MVRFPPVRRQPRAALLLPVFIVLAAAQALQRGSATGHSRFRAIAAQLSTDGIGRAGSPVCWLRPARLDRLPCLRLLPGGRSEPGGGQPVVPRVLARPQIRGSAVSYQPLLFLLVGSAGPLLANTARFPGWPASTPSAPTRSGRSPARLRSADPDPVPLRRVQPAARAVGALRRGGGSATFRQLRRTAGSRPSCSACSSWALSPRWARGAVRLPGPGLRAGGRHPGDAGRGQRRDVRRHCPAGEAWLHWTDGGRSRCRGPAAPWRSCWCCCYRSMRWFERRRHPSLRSARHWWRW